MFCSLTFPWQNLIHIRDESEILQISISHISKLFLVAFMKNEGYWFTSVMLENRGNQYLIYFDIWGNGKSINQSYDNNAFMRWPFANYPVLMNIHYYSISTTWPRIHSIACCCRQKTIKKCVIDFNWLLIKTSQSPSTIPNKKGIYMGKQ